MKRILFTLALILSVTMLSAQSKAVADAQKAIDKAVAATQDAKKAAKPATWTALADAYIKAYDIPANNLINGVSKTDVATLLKGQRPVSTESIVGAEGDQLEVDVYSDKKIYYKDGKLESWVVTAPVADNLLEKAKDALLKAVELGAKPADVAKKMEDIHSKYQSEAVNNYVVANYNEASDAFEAAAAAYDNKILNKIDTMSFYNSAFVAAMAKNVDRAIALYKACAEKGIYEDGNVFSNLADIYREQGDTEASKKALEDGFIAYPANQGILIGLINLYMDTKDDPQKIFDLIHAAEANEPNNASLFKAEGDVYKGLKDFDNAVKLYQKSSEVNPDYIYGTLAEGILYYDWAVEIQTAAAAELDDAKYMELNKQFEEVLLKAVDPFEKAFAASSDFEVKAAVAEYLKNVYFRFRDKDASYQEAYDKYNKFLAE